MNTLRFLSKAIGIGAVGISAYDICSETSRMGNNYAKYIGAKRAKDCYIRTSSTSSSSAFGSKFQNWIRERSLSNPLLRLIDKIRGYSKSAFSSAGKNVLTLGLGVITLLGTGKGLLGKIPVLGVASAALLATQGINFLLENVFGNSNNIK